MYKTIEEYLTDGNTWENLASYDFKNEAPWQEVREEKNAIKKFIMYRTYGKNEGESFDCDNSNGSCSLSDDIYMKLWGWNFQGRFTLPEFLTNKFSGYWTRFGSDTMNSFFTTYTCAVKIYGDSDTANKNSYLQKFAVLTHSIGNFTLVPFKLRPTDKKSFNQYRGMNFGKYFVCDYFDLSLKLIKENVNITVFKDYIDTFFLNDYVDQEYNIKPLITRHKDMLNKEYLELDNPYDFLPQNEMELNEYLQNVIQMIEMRAKRIVTVLKTGEEEDSKKKVKLKKTSNKKIVKGRNVLFSLVGFVFVLWVFLVIVGSLRLCNSLGGFDYLVKQHGVMAVISALWEELAESVLKFSISITISLVVLILILRFLWIWFANAKLHRCKKCKKLFALQKVQTDVLDCKNISILVETKSKNLYGETIGTNEQYIPGTRITYRDTFVCKYCGYEKQSNRTIDEKSI